MRTARTPGFVVHRGRAIPTLHSTAAMHEPLQPARLRQTKEKTNTDSKADERGEHATTIIIHKTRAPLFNSPIRPSDDTHTIEFIF